MKRKLALLLAGVMTLSSLPVNVFANTNYGRSTEQRLSHGTISAPNNTAFVTRGANTAASGAVTNNNDGVEQWLDGQDYVVVFRDQVTLDQNDVIRFDVELTNAEWYFNGGTLGNNISTIRPADQTNPKDTLDGRTFKRVYTDANRPVNSGNGQFLDYTLTVSQADPRRATVTVDLHDARKGTASTGTDENEGTEVVGSDKDIIDAATALNAVFNPTATAANTPATDAILAQNRNLRTFNALDADVKSDLTPLKEATAAAIKAIPAPVANAAEVLILNNALSDEAVVTLLKGTNYENFNAANADVEALQGLMAALSGIKDASKEIEDLNFALNNLTGVKAAIEATEVSTGVNYVIPNINANTSSATIATLITQIDAAISANTAGDNDADLDRDLELVKDAAEKLEAILKSNEAPLTGAVLAAYNAADALLKALQTPTAPEKTQLEKDLEVVQERITALEKLLPTNGSTNTPAAIAEGKKQINANDAISIPLVVRTTGDNQEASVRISNGTTIPAGTGTNVFATATETGLTTTRVHNPETGRETINVPAIAVNENRIGAMPTSGHFELVAPSGFQFVAGRDIKVTTEGGFGTNLTAKEGTTLGQLNDNRTVMTFNYEGLGVSTNSPGSLAITGVQLRPTNADTVRDGDVTVQIRSVGSPASVRNQSFVAGTVGSRNVNMSVIGEVPQLINGRLDGVEQTNVNDDSHKAATVKVEESMNDSWWATRTTTFTLPEEVRVRKVEFKEVKNVDSALAGTYYNNRNRNNDSQFVRVNDNVITVSGLTKTGGNTARASFEMDLWLNVESGYTGNIDMTIGGSAVNNANDAESVRIATAVNPVKVDAEVTNVKVGYQFVPVGNFTITETVPGALLEGEQVFITVTDEMSNDMHIANGFDWKVTEGDLLVKNVRTGTNLGLNNNNNNNNVNVSFEIDRESTKASTIEFSNVQLRMANTAPISNADAGYDLVVWGPAVAANFDGVRPANDRGIEVGHADYISSNDFFRTAGIRTNYINVQGSGNDVLTNVVRVTAGSDVIMVGDQPMQMDTAAYVSEASDSMMVPVRFVSYALGIPASGVLWDAATSTATINTGTDIIQFQTNSHIIKINGIDMPMLNANGEPVYSEVRDERAFIPFRALGNALNVHVSWEADTATAIFDPTKEPVSLLTANAEEAEAELAS